MRIGYAKLGRAMPLSPASWGVVGGDDEPPLLLKTLAERHPEHEFVLVGRNSGEEPSEVGLPRNVTNPWTPYRSEIGKRTKGMLDKGGRVTDHWGIVRVFDEISLPWFADLDGLVVWAGQHGTSNTPIPPVGSSWSDTLTNPQTAFCFYAGYLIRGINMFRRDDPVNREEVWLHPDPRNYVKCRDLKWPPVCPQLGQFNFERWEKHERYGDTRDPGVNFCNTEWKGDHVWYALHRYMYSRLEICGVLPEHVPNDFADNWEERDRFGLFINEARSYVKWNRLDALRDYVLPNLPDFIHGKWSKKSLEALHPWKIESAPADRYYDLLRSVKCTFTTPSSGSGWATTKPWQAFATGTVCFFHPQYDTQDHILGDNPELRTWLRVDSPSDLTKRIDYVNSSRDAWHWLVTEQRKLYDQACAELRHIKLIEGRLGLEA